LRTASLTEIRSSVAALQRTLKAFSERTEAAVQSKTASMQELFTSTLEFFEGDIDSFVAFLKRESPDDEDKVRQLVSAASALLLSDLRSISQFSKVLEIKTFGLEDYKPAYVSEGVKSIALDFSSGFGRHHGLRISAELLTSPASLEQLQIDFKENYGVSIESLSGHILFTDQDEEAAARNAEELSQVLRRGGVSTSSRGPTIIISNSINEGESQALMQSLIQESGWIIDLLSKEANSKIEISFATTIAELSTGHSHPTGFLRDFKLTGLLNLKADAVETANRDLLLPLQQVVISGISQLLGTCVHLKVNFPEQLMNLLKGFDLTSVALPNPFTFFNGGLAKFIPGIFMRDSAEEHFTLVISLGEVAFKLQIKPNVRESS
jgi:hypothetical protein